MYSVCAHPVWAISSLGSFNFLLSLFGNMDTAVLDCSCPTVLFSITMTFPLLLYFGAPYPLPCSPFFYSS